MLLFSKKLLNVYWLPEKKELFLQSKICFGLNNPQKITNSKKANLSIHPNLLFEVLWNIDTLILLLFFLWVKCNIHISWNCCSADVVSVTWNSPLLAIAVHEVVWVSESPFHEVKRSVVLRVLLCQLSVF